MSVITGIKRKLLTVFPLRYEIREILLSRFAIAFFGCGRANFVDF